MSGYPAGNPLVRFRQKVAVNAETGCHEWIGAVVANGYARFKPEPRRGGPRIMYAHRWIYEHARGPIPAGLVIDHLCRNRRCVNPDHLEVVTQQVNIRRGGPKKKRRRKTHCKRGHVFDAANTYMAANGGQVCRKCHADRARLERQELKKLEGASRPHKGSDPGRGPDAPGLAAPSERGEP